MIPAPSLADRRSLPTFRANQARLATLAEISGELSVRFASRISVTEEVGARPPAYALRLTGGRLFATFGVIDATYYWTFDGGESCHYAKDESVMRRLFTWELRLALTRGNAL